jgi:hypothetical protein
MTQFYFHVWRNGIRTADEVGLAFDTRHAACSDAFTKTPSLLASAVTGQRDIYVITEVWDATHALYVVRASIQVEALNGTLIV